IGKTQVADYVGDFDAEGNLYTFQASVNRITKIDVDSIDGSGMMAQSHYYLPSNLVSGNTYDVAYNAADNSFYGLRPPSSDGQPGTVIKIDMTNFDGSNEPVITEFTVGNTLIDGVMKTGMAKSAYGAIFLDGAGNLYAGLNRGDHDLDGSTPVSGAVYKIHLDEASGQSYAEHLADSQVSGYNDGAVDPRSVDPFAEKDLTSTVVIREPNFVASSGGDDQLRGGAGNDELHGGILDDTVHGGDDDDIVMGDEGNDFVSGDAGDDMVIGGVGNDKVFGGAGIDTLDGGEGDDLGRGGEGANVYDMGEGDDTVEGGSGAETIEMGTGADLVYAKGGADVVNGGAGADTLYGEDGNDVLDGGAGVDRMMGGSGADDLFGGAGADKMLGGAGADTLEGGSGNDHLWGNSWAGADGVGDTFTYSHGGGSDMIHDFEAAHDLIDLSAYGLSYSDVSARMIDRGWATEINLEGIDKSGAGDKLLLKAIKPEDLDSDNFIL
ncbi:MAG: calcium-binding protein, partial [Shimia sp.]